MARGSTYRRGGSWYYTVDLPKGRDGKRRQQRRGGFRTRKAAEAALEAVKADLWRTRYGGDDRITVATFAARWLDAIEGDVAAKTWEGYETQVRLRVVPEVGHLAMRDVDPLTLKRLYTTCRDTPRTARYVHQTMSRMFGDAARWGVIAANPVDQVDAPAYEADEKRAWSAVELARFLEAVADRRDGPLWWFAALTGLRRGDVLGLRWGDLDFDSGTVRIARAAKQRGGVGATKTGDRRTIALDQATVGMLRRWRHTVLEDAIRWGWKVDDRTPVWVWPTGEPLRPDWMTKTFPKLAGPLGLPDITLHGLRHTYLSLGARAGVHPRVMQGRVGHRDIRVTLETYTHVADDADRDAAEAIAQLVNGEAPPDPKAEGRI